ncbi:MAG TPA: universal stress protein [Solirubrobacteraceae bacterium]|jgi:nucleotide-binding universal stress UspA family protein|nr:universal stress protein [Solirubrobacteraceae bacterium]
MFKNVLVGVDGRSSGRDAIVLARRLLADDGHLTLVHVHGGAPRSPHSSIPVVATNAEQEALELLQRERDATEAQADLLPFCASSPGHGLHVLAEQRQADLIVVGSCSRSGIGRVMLGDDTRASLNGAPCAVAVAVRGYFEHPMPIATIGVGYDGSPESERALAAARGIAARNQALIRALHVVMLPSYTFAGIAAPAVGESVDALLEDARIEVEGLEGVSGRAVYGLAGEELASFGEEVDLLIVGSRNYGPVKRLMLGSTSNHLQRHARCSLLVLPRGAASEGDHAQDSTFPQPGAASDR